MSTPRNFEASDVEEAIKLAQKLKQNGNYDWFRGQIKTWPLKPSFLRLDQEKRSEALEKLRRFESWIRNTAGLESLTANTDSMVAVAQHYGLPTNFIDFTTSPEIAGFFASCGEQTEEDQLSCILCLNTKDLMEFWKILPSKYPLPELLLSTFKIFGDCKRNTGLSCIVHTQIWNISTILIVFSFHLMAHFLALITIKFFPRERASLKYFLINIS